MPSRTGKGVIMDYENTNLEVDDAQTNEEVETSVDETNSQDLDLYDDSLRDDIIDSLNNDGSSETKAENNETESTEQAVDTKEIDDNSKEIEAVEIGSNVSLREGEKLTKDHINEIKRSFLRESDYTKKTQELSRHRKEALDVINAHKAINEDPKNLRQYYSAEKIFDAFTPKEHLVSALERYGVDPNEWNDFLQMKTANGEQVASKRVDPYAQELGNLKHEVNRMKQMTEQEKHQAVEVQRQRKLSEFNNQVDNAINPYETFSKEELLIKLKNDNSYNTLSLEEAAKRLDSEKQVVIDRMLSKRVNSIKEKKAKQIQPPKGHVAPVMRGRPQTFDDAMDAATDFLSRNS